MAARNRIWERLGERQQRRYARQGVTPSYYESGGRLQRFRGHKEREHITRRERNPLGLTATDYRFIKRQQIRATKKGAEKLKDFTRQIAAYKRLSPAQRTALRNKVNADHRRYAAGKSKSWKSKADLKGEWRGVFTAGGSGGDDYDRDTGEIYDDEPDDDEGPHSYADDYYGYDDFTDDYPDLDDLDDLMFYH